MGGLSIWHWIIVIGVVLLLFGRGKISELMGDVAQGIKAFKKGMAEEKPENDASKDASMKSIEHAPGASPDLKTRAETEKRVEGGTV